MKISAFFWLVCPLVIVLSYLFVTLALPLREANIFLLEDGPYEWLQFFLILGAFFAAVACMGQPGFKSDRLMALWVTLAAIGAFYVTGEEISWGQRVFHWITPASWDLINDHHETNLHNTNQWIDQKPKAVLEYGIIIFGLTIPFLQRYCPEKLPARFAAFYPPAFLAVTAGGLLFFRVGKEVCTFTRECAFIRASEMKETLIYYYLLFYLMNLRSRLKRAH